MDFATRLKEKRPNLSASSLKTYDSLLRSLAKAISTEDFAKNVPKVLDHVASKPMSSKKTILSALFVLTGKPEFQEAMKKGIKDYTEHTSKQEMTQKQKDNFLSGEELAAMFNGMTEEIKGLLKLKTFSPANLARIQQYVMLALYSGVYIPPRRAQDYTEFKISNVDKAKDNYFDGKQLVFNTYKTAKNYGQQTVEVPKELAALLKRWIAINPTDFLFFDVNRAKLDNVQLNQRLNRLVGKKSFGVNGFRHSYMTTKYGKTIEEDTEMAKDFEDMGSSMAQQKVYIQKK